MGAWRWTAQCSRCVAGTLAAGARLVQLSAGTCDKTMCEQQELRGFTKRQVHAKCMRMARKGLISI